MTVELGSASHTELKVKDATILIATSLRKEGDQFILTMHTTPPLRWKAALNKEGKTLDLEGVEENKGRMSLAKK